MNRRLIEKILTKKHEEFLASIKDEELRKLVDRDAIITGGSIVSLLLGEPVNDYDYYFRTKMTVLKVAEYYIKEFRELNPKIDAVPLVIDEGTRIKIRIKSAGVVAEEGAVANVLNEEDARSTGEPPVPEKEDTKPRYRPVFISANAISLSNKVQLVVRFYGEPEEIHKNYDFIHCCNYWTADNHILTLNPLALESILTKQLTYQGSLYPLCSVIRMRKFLKQGWYINAGQILKMLFQASELDLKDLKVLEDQLTGVDAAYFFEVIDYCKERLAKEPDFKVTVPYLCAIIDKIFG